MILYNKSYRLLKNMPAPEHFVLPHHDSPVFHEKTPHSQQMTAGPGSVFRRFWRRFLRHASHSTSSMYI